MMLPGSVRPEPVDPEGGNSQRPYFSSKKGLGFDIRARQVARSDSPNGYIE